MVIARGELNLN